MFASYPLLIFSIFAAANWPFRVTYQTAFQSLSKMPGTCKFQDSWLLTAEFKDWVRRVPGNVHSAFCILCNKKIDITTMGRTGLT